MNNLMDFTNKGKFNILLIYLMSSSLAAVVCALEKDQDEIYFCEASSSAKFAEIPSQLMETSVSKSFRASVKDLKCPAASKVLHNTSSTDDVTFQFLSSGDIVFPQEDYLLRNEYCVISATKQSIEIKSCEVECGVTHTCIYKCCHPNEFVNFSEDHNEKICTTLQNTTAWKPVFYSAHEGCGKKAESVPYHLLPLPMDVYSAFQPYKHVRVNFTMAENGSTDELVTGLRFRLMSDGNLMSQTVFGGWKKIERQEFCIDGVTGYLGSDQHSYDNVKDQVFLTIESANNSYAEEYNEVNIVLEYMYIPLMLFGAFFLFLTALLYLLIWEKHNIHGWTILAFVVTMFFMFIFLAVSKIFSISKRSDFSDSNICKGVGILTHFFSLATISWLTIINLDLWLTFRNIKPGAGKSQNITRFLLYTSFAFGVPFLIVTLAVTLDEVYKGGFGDGSECEPPVTLPLYGEQQCNLQPESAGHYLYIPITILLTSNILTFSSTVFTLCMYRSQTRNAVANTSNKSESLVVFGKLFIVTGLCWILELMSHTLPNLWVMWLVSDIYNLLQTVLIFLIFGMKKENLVFLYQKYPSGRYIIAQIFRTKCWRAEIFDPEKTDVTTFDQRHSTIQFRRGSNSSATSNKSVSFK